LKPSPFSSPENFRHNFETGLQELLSGYDELGVYILVLANAGFDPVLWQVLGDKLRRRFLRLAANMRETDRQGLILDDAEDDLSVFRRLLAVGFDGLSATEFRQVGPWELQFNPLRAFRPARMTGKAVTRITAPYDPAGFNFNKPFLRKEILWQGWLCGRNAAVFYNKFPFVEMHGLLVPEPRAGLSQFLRERDNDYLWQLTETLARTLPGVGFGYNSLGAYASVNHLHFQMFQRRRMLPVADPLWQHNGGSLAYPLRCQCFFSSAEAWRLVSELHRRNISYNLIYLPGRIYCLRRLRQGEYSHSPWARGFAWYETAGGFTIFERENFNSIGQQELASELALLADG